MKNRIYSYLTSTFFFCILFALLQIAYLGSLEEYVKIGFTGGAMLYHMMTALIVAVVMECWCYLLPRFVSKSTWIYLMLFASCILLWFAPFYVTLFLKFVYSYLVILMAYQLFMYKEANEQLKKMQDQL